MKAKLDETFSGSTPGVRLSDIQVDALIKQLREIAHANIDLISESEATRAESQLMRKRSRILQWMVSIAFILGCFVAVAIYVNVTRATDRMLLEAEEATAAFMILDEDVTTTLDVVRALSDAHAAKIKADVDMDSESESEAKRKAEETQLKVAEAEVKIQKDPAKKARAVKHLKSIKKNGHDHEP